jgi:hypothetical protein
MQSIAFYPRSLCLIGSRLAVPLLKDDTINENVSRLNEKIFHFISNDNLPQSSIFLKSHNINVGTYNFYPILRYSGHQDDRHNFSSFKSSKKESFME